MKRLAAILLLYVFTLAPAGAGSDGHLKPEQAKDHIGEHATVCGTVESAKFLHSTAGQPTFLNFGAPFPRHKFTVVIWGRHRKKFGRPERDLLGKQVCATGRIRDYRGRAEMEVASPDMIRQSQSEAGKPEEAAAEEKEG